MAEVFDSVTRTVAIMVGRSTEMDAVAERVAATMKSVAYGIGDHELGDSVKIRKAGAGKDRIIGPTDPLAVPKVFGHVVRNRGDGPVLGYVPGNKLLYKTLARLHEEPSPD